MDDNYGHYSNHIDAPGVNAWPIEPDDETNMDLTTRGIYVGGAGDLSVVMKSEAVVTLKNVAAGTILPLRAIRVNSTGTSATDLVGLE